MNNKGFIQIKILTILFIIGIICFTVVPNFLNYYSNSKKEEYITIAKKYISKVKDSINSLEYKQIPEVNQGLIVKLSNIDLDLSSPYGRFKDDYSYVIVLNMGEVYDYYFASIDSSYWGIPIVNERELSVDSVVYGKSKLTSINKVSSIDNLYLSGTLFEESVDTKENDKNIIITPISGELTVSYEFKKDVHKIYDNLIKNVDTDIYNKEATVNNGTLKYNNEVISSGYSNDINGFFRYISFPNDEEELYYSSYVNYSKSYVAGIINSSEDYSTSDIIFDSLPTVVINKDARVVTDNNKKYLMWNLMAIYPDNSNYTITECGALILKNNSATEVDLSFKTMGVMTGKSNNGCELGNIFAIRKNNIKTNDRFFARGYIKYKDISGKEYTTYSRDTISALVK